MFCFKRKNLFHHHLKLYPQLKSEKTIRIVFESNAIGCHHRKIECLFTANKHCQSQIQHTKTAIPEFERNSKESPWKIESIQINGTFEGICVLRFSHSDIVFDSFSSSFSVSYTFRLFVFVFLERNKSIQKRTSLVTCRQWRRICTGCKYWTWKYTTQTRNMRRKIGQY